MSLCNNLIKDIQKVERMSKNMSEKVKVPISPMIDIIFLMIFFFVINSVFDTDMDDKIDLVKVEHCKPSQIEAKKVYLNISKDGIVQVGGSLISIDKQLENSVNNIVQTWGSSTKFIIRADKETVHSKIDNTLIKLKESGAHNIIVSGEIVSN